MKKPLSLIQVKRFIHAVERANPKAGGETHHEHHMRTEARAQTLLVAGVSLAEVEADAKRFADYMVRAKAAISA